MEEEIRKLVEVAGRLHDVAAAMFEPHGYHGLRGQYCDGGSIWVWLTSEGLGAVKFGADVNVMLYSNSIQFGADRTAAELAAIAEDAQKWLAQVGEQANGIGGAA